MYATAVVLVAGAAWGASVWLTDVDTPISYDEPYTIEMSDQTDDSTAGDFEAVPYKSTTTLSETADFTASGDSSQYHEYVKVVNPEATGSVNLKVEIEQPQDFDDTGETMGFTVLDGHVEPGDVEDVQVEQWRSITHEMDVSSGETAEFTVVYTLGDDAPSSDGHEVQWKFNEGGIWIASVEQPVTYGS